MHTTNLALKGGNRKKEERRFNKARKEEKGFATEMKDNTYWLYGANRWAAIVKYSRTFTAVGYNAQKMGWKMNRLNIIVKLYRIQMKDFGL